MDEFTRVVAIQLRRMGMRLGAEPAMARAPWTGSEWSRAVERAVRGAQASGSEQDWTAALGLLSQAAMAGRHPAQRVGMEMERLGIDPKLMPPKAARALAGPIVAAGLGLDGSPDLERRDRIVWRGHWNNCLAASAKLPGEAFADPDLLGAYKFSMEALRSEIKFMDEQNKLDVRMAKEAIHGAPGQDPKESSMRAAASLVEQARSSGSESDWTKALSSLADVALAHPLPESALMIMIEGMEIETKGVPRASLRAMARLIEGEKELAPQLIFKRPAGPAPAPSTAANLAAWKALKLSLTAPAKPAPRR